MALRIAVVGSGPAGLYCAEKLLRDAPQAEIDVVEKLPTPFGLVRAGVAPDHQGTKAVTRVLERMFRRGGRVAFWGNVEVGRDVTLAELRSLYDAVVVATGAPLDRRLGVPGEDLPGIYGSGAFVGWYNSLPAHADLAPRLERARSAVVVGNGNVAIDVARTLAKTAAEMRRSDLHPEIGDALSQAPLETIWIVGRRGSAETGFSPAELVELGQLERAAPDVAPADLPADPAADTPTLRVLRGFASAERGGKPVAIRFLFNHRPREIVGTADGVSAVRFGRTGAAGGVVDVPADLVVTCIGYGAAGCCSLQPDPERGVFRNEDGRIEDGLYAVGWAKRGPSGTIPTNRTEAHAVAQRLLREVLAEDRHRGRAGLEALLRERAVDVVNWTRWERIDAREVEQGVSSGRPRQKFRTLEALLGASSEVVPFHRDRRVADMS